MKTAKSGPSRYGNRKKCAAVLAFLLFPPLAQSGPAGSATPQFKAEARLVLVDAVVTGKKDEPIHGLTAEDFHVFEDGKEQTITGFQTRTGPAVPGMNRQQHFLLLLDARDDQGIELKWVQQAAAKFIADNIGPNRLMSVAYYGAGCTPTVTIAAQFTADVGQLQHALDAWPGLNCCPPFHDKDGHVRARACAQLAKDLAHVQGHKLVVLFAAGVPAPIVDAGVAAQPADPSIRFGDKVSLDFDNRRQFDDFVRRPLRYEHQFEIAPGNYRFKLIFRTAGDRVGVIETPLAVDPFDAKQLGVSAIALSRDVQPISQDAVDEEIEAGKKPLLFRGNRITVSGSDVLPRSGTAEAYFEIYHPPAAGAETAQLTMHLRLLDAQSNKQRWDSGDVDLSALAKPGSRVIPVAFKLPVAALAPGAYRAELTVKDAAEGEAARSIQFRVE